MISKRICILLIDLFLFYKAAITDSALGKYTTNVIFDDTDIAQLNAIPHDSPHRLVDLKVMDADEEGYAKTYNVSPAGTYDVAHHCLVNAGISNSRTILFKLLVPVAVKRGYGITIGKGENIWLNVHIDELTDFYELLFKSVLDPLKSQDVPHGRNGYFLIGADEHRSYQQDAEISRALFDLGMVKNIKPTEFTVEEAIEYFGPRGGSFRAALGGNARFASNNAKSLGWKPAKTTRDYLDSLANDVQFWARATKSQ
ncbi:hypothetical protein PQX77_020932 [Marasmius sp. AFHP31]|nr:hypothetical protein PQX77_020932 [Marasmius sp. AFHP31]